MKLSEARSKGIFRTVIHIGEFFEGYKEGDVWIKMREPSTEEANRLREEGGLEEIKKVVQTCIEDHNFEDEQGAKAPAGEVLELISSSSGMFTKVLNVWQESLPLLKMNGRKSNDSHVSSSTVKGSPGK